MVDKKSSKGAATSHSGSPPATPMPSRGRISASSPLRPTEESLKVGAMNDYPRGRGGMRAAAMANAPAVAPAIQPTAPIGARPPAQKMPR